MTEQKEIDWLNEVNVGYLAYITAKYLLCSLLGGLKDTFVYKDDCETSLWQCGIADGYYYLFKQDFEAFSTYAKHFGYTVKPCKQKALEEDPGSDANGVLIFEVGHPLSERSNSDSEKDR